MGKAPTAFVRILLANLYRGRRPVRLRPSGWCCNGISAESPAGGIRITMVPKDGGNTFKGAAFAGYAPGRLQSDNFTPELRARGLRAVRGVQLLGAIDAFNTLNSSAVFNQVQTHGSSLGRPTDVIQGRMFRFTAQATF